MKNSILYSVKVGGSNVSVFNIKNVLSGIIKNVFYENYEIHLSIENSIIPDVKIYFENHKMKFFASLFVAAALAETDAQARIAVIQEQIMVS